MKTKYKKAIAAGAMALSLVTVGACTQADRVSQNISTEADNFNVTRRIVVINSVNDTPTFTLTGNFSIKVNEEQDKLDITVKSEDGKFLKHFVGLGPTVTYVIEDLSGSNVSPYRYQVSYLPEAIIPYEFKNGTSE